MAMRAAWFLLVLCGWTVAQPAWMPVSGEPQHADRDTVEVDVSSPVSIGTARLVRIRVNRQHESAHLDGSPFRSHVSSVVIDCVQRTARHSHATFYRGPLWTGDQRTVSFPVEQMPLMAFLGMQPNPHARIIKAACALDLVKR